MRQPVQVAIYCVRRANREWEYLILHRLPSNGNFWQGVTGGVEGVETIPEAARRELREETGFEPTNLHDIGFSYCFDLLPEWEHLYQRGIREITEHVFVAIIDNTTDPVISAIEHDDWRWCGLDEALNLLYWDGNKKSLQRCHDFLQAL